MLCSAAALECIAFGVAGSLGIGAVYLDRRGGTFAVIVIGTIVGFTVNLDLFAATAVSEAVGHGSSDTFLKASAAGFACIGSIFTGYVDLSFGTELIFVVDTFDC